jgi:hypothetical protein
VPVIFYLRLQNIKHVTMVLIATPINIKVLFATPINIKNSICNSKTYQRFY